MTIRYKQLIDLMVMQNPYVSKGVAGGCLDSLLSTLRKAASEGHSVDLRGYGKLAVKLSAPRRGFNPATKQVLEIPAKMRVRFIPDVSLATPKVATTAPTPSVGPNDRPVCSELDDMRRASNP